MKQGFLLLATLAALAPAAFAQEDQKAIQARYDQRSAAAAKKDVAGALRINAPEFISIGLKGDKRTLAQIKPQITQVFAIYKSYLLTTKITKCVVQDDKATVRTQDRVQLVGQKTEESEATSEDLWVKRDGQWLRTQNKLLTSKIKNSKTGK